MQSTRITRTVAVAAMALAMTVMTVAAALAQDPAYPPGPAGASVQKEEVAPSDLNRFTIDGCVPGSEVTGEGTYGSGGTFFTGAETADDDGSATFVVEIPSDAPDGPATFTMTCDGGDETLVLGVQFTVDSALPVTGGQFTLGTALAAGVLVLGAALVLVSRRKTREFEVETP